MAGVRNIATSLILMLTWGAVAVAEDTKAVREISVSGTVEAKTAPDRAVWHISLRDTDKNLQEAKRRNDERVKAILALREKLKLPEGDLETGHVGVYREYEQTQRGERGNFKHFVVSRDVTIRQRDLKRFDQFLETLLASSDMEVNFQLESSRFHEVRSQTRLKALQVAKEKAAAMAAELGGKLGPVLKIEEYRPRETWQSPISNAGFTESAPTPDQGSETFVPGAISVRATVYVTFELR
jgi:uncharacterized protein YggE